MVVIRYRQPSLTDRQWLLLKICAALAAALTFLYCIGSSPQSALSGLPVLSLGFSSQKLDPHAYVFYATQDSYACSALVNIQIIKATTKHPIYCFVTKSVSKPYIERLESLGVYVIVEVPPPLNSGTAYYEDVLLKLVAFKMHHYIPHLRRVITMDADQLVLGDLDHLFLLPTVTLAAPRAYWIDGGPISSTMMVIELSNTTWSRVEEGLRTIGHDTYDMDLVQDLFKDDVLMLPGQYASINSHWEAWDIPSWFTGYGHLDRISDSDRSTIETEERLLELFKQSQIMHFFAVGKPWSFTIDEVKHSRPRAHWLLAKQFELWQEKADKICLSKLDRLYRYYRESDPLPVTMSVSYDEDENDENHGGDNNAPPPTDVDQTSPEQAQEVEEPTSQGKGDKAFGDDTESVETT